jgi:shikimate dehydrogenase
MKINQHTDLYGVLGYPLSHSLSPALHNTAFSVTGLNAVYLAFETRDIDRCLQGMRGLGIKGMSVTLPHKSAVIPLLDEVDDRAKAIGAVNTIVNRGGRLIGYNTDAHGALHALEEKTQLTGKTAVVIGAGGAARAIGFILREKGVHLTVVNRSRERGKALAHALACPFIPLDGLGERTADILIHATSVGMMPHTDACLVPEHFLKPAMVVMDIIYHPMETRLLRMARDRGCETVSGLGMFIHQGAEQFRLWTGLAAPIRAVTEAVKAVMIDNGP